MSDLKERVGYMTGGNANLVPYKGALVTGDGEQAVYLMPPTPGSGLVLKEDPTVPEGISWQAEAGGASKLCMSATFIDDEEAVAPSNGVNVIASTGRDFSIFAAGATITFNLVIDAYNQSASAISVNPEVRIYVNCANAASVSGGTLVATIPVPDLTLTKYSLTGTFVAPAGAGFVLLGMVRGTDDGGPFSVTARSVGITFVGNGA